MSKVVAVLEIMWDDRGMTSAAGYTTQAPTHFRINGANHTGRRLYQWLGHHDLLVTNACPQLATSAKGRGTPDPVWLSRNLQRLQPFSLLLVCGRVAQQTYSICDTGDARIIELPHPAARSWTRRGLAFTQRLIREGTADLNLSFGDGGIIATPLLPF